MSSSSSSGSRTPSPSGSHPTRTLNSFDPFAVHPFTSYAGQSQPPASRGHPLTSGAHPLPHPSMLNLDRPMPSPIHHPSASYAAKPNYTSTHSGVAGYQTVGVPASPAAYPAYIQSNMTPSQNFQSIHVPFRQDTSSPDLSEVLRRKRMGL